MKLKKSKPVAAPAPKSNLIKVDFTKVEEPVTDVAEQLEKLIDEIEEEIKNGTAAKHQTSPAPVPEATRAVVTQKTRTKPKGEKVTVNPAELVTLKELSSELKIEGKVLRKWLRKHMPKAEGRWEWKKDDPVVKLIRDAFKGKSK